MRETRGMGASLCRPKPMPHGPGVGQQSKSENLMNTTETRTVSVGMEVPSFEMEIYDPADREFGKISLDKLKKSGQVDHPGLLPGRFHLCLPH